MFLFAGQIFKTIFFLGKIHGRIVVKACVEYREERFIGVGDIHPDRQHFQIFCQFEQTKMAISRLF